MASNASRLMKLSGPTDVFDTGNAVLEMSEHTCES
jgi:hypothetical protein